MILLVSSFPSNSFYSFLIFNFVIIIACLIPISVATADVTGKPRVIDGDTIEIAGTRIRLNGIDAPEENQTCLDEVGLRWQCGKASTFTLLNLIGYVTMSKIKSSKMKNKPLLI